MSLSAKKPTRGQGRIYGEEDPLAIYLRQISRYPLLSPEQEQQIGERLRSLRDRINSIKEKNSPNDGTTSEKFRYLVAELKQLKNQGILSNLVDGAPFK